MSLKLIDIKKILRMDTFIRRKSSGTPQEFARRLDFSRSTLFEYLAYLKEEFGAVVHYNKYSHNYEYETEPKGLYGKQESNVVDISSKEQSQNTETECQCSFCNKLNCCNRRVDNELL